MTEILFKTDGSIFGSDCEALVNPVNTYGVCGKGLALKFKNMYPMNYRIYRRAYIEHALLIGKIITCQAGGKTILNFPTKDHWRYPSRIEYIEKGLKSLRGVIQNLELKSVAMPALGCGEGGLDWKEVKDLILLEVKNWEFEFDFYLEVYDPQK